MPIETKYPKLSLQQIEQWETNNIAIPAPYKKFLLENNGGEVSDEKNVFDIPKMKNSSIIRQFFGMHEGSYGLDYIQETFTKRDRFPKKYFAIASDMLGNLILMGQGEKNLGQVFFWDHENEVDDGEKPHEKNIYKVAKDLDGFIKNLYEIEEEPYNEDDPVTLFAGNNTAKQLELINSGWDVNEYLPGSYQTAIERVANFGTDPVVLQALLDKGANIGKAMLNVLYSNKDTAVLFARMLLDAGADPDYASEKERLEKDTLLKSAVNTPMTKIEIAKLLIQYGADVFVENDYGWTALKIAQRTLERGVPEMQEVIDLINSKPVPPKEDHEFRKANTINYSILNRIKDSMAKGGAILRMTLDSVMDMNPKLVFIGTLAEHTGVGILNIPNENYKKYVFEKSGYAGDPEDYNLEIKSISSFDEGKGIGNRLMELLTQGVSEKMMATVEDKNAVMIHLLNKYGFEQQGHSFETKRLNYKLLLFTREKP